jgi:hypothetical protein
LAEVRAARFADLVMLALAIEKRSATRGGAWYSRFTLHSLDAAGRPASCYGERS